MTATPYGASVKRFHEEEPRTVSMPLLRIDPLLLLATLGLVACGIYTIYTATDGDIPGSPYYYMIRQGAYAGVGLVLMLLVSRFDYSRLREWRWALYGVMVFTILVTLGLGSVRGSKRWISLPFFNFQPSELGKVLLTLALAGFLVDRTRRLGEREATARIMLLTVIPTMLVIAQPDLGSAFVYIAIALALLFVAGTKWTHFAALGVLGAAAVTAVLVLAPMGRGPNGATQTKLDFIPEHHTDFVYSVVGEEFGFVGAATVLSLYALVIWRGLRILTMAKNLYGSLIAGGIVVMLMFQVFVNVGMTVGIMPITGVPLPLMSYGGSSVIVTLLALGLLQAVHVQARETALAKGRQNLL